MPQVEMKMATGAPMKMTPIVCQKPSTSTAQTIDPEQREDDHEQARNLENECPGAEGGVTGHSDTSL